MGREPKQDGRRSEYLGKKERRLKFRKQQQKELPETIEKSKETPGADPTLPILYPRNSSKHKKSNNMHKFLKIMEGHLIKTFGEHGEFVSKGRLHEPKMPRKPNPYD